MLKALIAFRKANQALAKGKWGARIVQVVNDRPQQLFAFIREQDGNRVVGLFNLSAEPVMAILNDGLAAGVYREFRTGQSVTVTAGAKVTLEPWAFQLLAKGAQK